MTPSYSNASWTNGSATRSVGVGALGRLMEMGGSSLEVGPLLKLRAQTTPRSEINHPIRWIAPRPGAPWVTQKPNER
nr:hypothetical protein GCM10020063_011740 [Dactylosporangium thailandense]